MSDELKQRYDALKEQIAVLKKEFKVQAAKLFGAECKKVFAEYPELRSFSWTQYTPWFNDGNTCVFRVSDYGLRIDMPGGEADEELQNGDVWSIRTFITKGETWRKAPFTPTPAHHALVRVAAFLNQFDDGIMQDLFGDHVRVTVHSTGKCDTEEHHHD